MCVFKEPFKAIPLLEFTIMTIHFLWDRSHTFQAGQTPVEAWITLNASCLCLLSPGVAGVYMMSGLCRAGIKPRASWMLSKRSTARATSPVLFVINGLEKLLVLFRVATSCGECCSICPLWFSGLYGHSAFNTISLSSYNCVFAPKKAASALPSGRIPSHHTPDRGTWRMG